MSGIPPHALPDSITDASEFVDRRETPGRRAVDLEHQLERSAVYLYQNRGKIFAAGTSIVALVTGVVTFLVTTMGLRGGALRDVTDLRRDVAKRDTVINARIDHVEAIASVNAGRITTVETKMGFMIYLQCVQLRRTDPPAVPEFCGNYQTPPHP